ncbi:MAG: hypothetical protein ACOX1P_21280 [Thermoguttaceae bacterium]
MVAQPLAKEVVRLRSPKGVKDVPTLVKLATLSPVTIRKTTPIFCEYWKAEDRYWEG